MADEEFGGDPGDIAQAGEGYREAASDVKGNVSSRQVSLTVPGGTNASWITGAAGTGSTTGWQTYLTGLAGQLEEHGVNLVTAGREYRAADRVAMKAG